MLRLLYNSITNSRRFNKYSAMSLASIISLSAYYVFYKNKLCNRYPDIKLEKLNKDVNADLDVELDVDLYVYSDVDSIEELEDFLPNEKVNIFCHYFNTPHSIENGLKHIKTMPLLEAGLFDMGYLNNHTLWMRDTYIPLDIIFINNHNIIVDKIENTSPLSDESLFVNKLSYYIIEANAGFYKKFSLKIGMNINDVFNLIMII